MARRLNQRRLRRCFLRRRLRRTPTKFVTLNPAKLLHMITASAALKVGKDADLALWSDHPLSIYAVAEKTQLLDGTFLQPEEDRKQREGPRRRTAAACPEDAGKEKEKNPACNGKQQYEQYHCDDNEMRRSN